jgi:hypothetical protein
MGTSSSSSVTADHLYPETIRRSRSARTRNRGVHWWQVPTKKREPANVEEKEMQYLCKEGGELVFIDPSSRVQVTVSQELVGDAADLMTNNPRFRQHQQHLRLPVGPDVVVSDRANEGLQLIPSL